MAATTSVSRLERKLDMLRFSIQMLALQTPHCGPGQSASQEAREAYLCSQDQLDSLIAEHEQTLKSLWLEKQEEQQRLLSTTQTPRQRRMTIC